MYYNYLQAVHIYTFRNPRRNFGAGPRARADGYQKKGLYQASPVGKREREERSGGVGLRSGSTTYPFWPSRSPPGPQVVMPFLCIAHLFIIIYLSIKNVCQPGRLAPAPNATVVALCDEASTSAIWPALCHGDPPDGGSLPLPRNGQKTDHFGRIACNVPVQQTLH